MYALLLILVLSLQGVPEALPDPPGPVIWLHLADEAITPVTVRYINRGLAEAARTDASCLVIELDTPGGLMESTREIVRKLLDSPVPVVVYVSPSGARAASAGVFITLASHVAAMAPATHIGAAHPVSIGGPLPAADTTGGGPGVMEEKIVNDAVAWVRSLADLRGRNADWAARAVAESVSITAREALAQGVIDLVSPNAADLLARLDGRTVSLPAGDRTLHTAGATVQQVEMWWGERLLALVSNPNIAFLLLMLGFYGILFELYTPGWGVSGTVGAISIVLAFFGLAVLPINYAGLALIALALGLFVAEAFFTSYGALTLGGAVCLVLGGIMLIDTPAPVMRVSTSVVIPVALATALITFFLMTRLATVWRTAVRTGSETLTGTQVRTEEAFVVRESGYEGMIRVHGALWKAVSDRPVPAGARVEIIGRDGLTLQVRLQPDAAP